MSLIPEVKCRRCGETFSSLRSRCPNCGTRRVSQSTRTPGATPGTVKGTASYDRAFANTRWQMIFGLILVVAVILAVIVMVSTSLNGNGASGAKATPTPAQNTDTVPTPEAPPTPTPSPTPTIEKIVLHSLWSTNAWENNEFTMESTSEDVVVLADVYPLDIQNPEITWSVEDDSIISVTVDPEKPKQCTVSYVGPGHGKLICQVFGSKTELTIYCR